MFFGRKQEITHADTTVRARAKINLTLDVTGRREDGYHTVEMVMQSIALHDTVRVTTIHGEKKPRGIVLSCSLPFLPTDERNLAYRAAELFYKETGALLETCEIHIEKRIPVAAGLAGGSTDAAAVLRALNALHTAGLTDDELCEMGLKLGADVPFCLRGGTMLAQGIGEELTKLPPVPQCQVLVAKPGINVATKFVYENLHANDLKPEQHPDIDGMIQAIQDQDLQGIAGKLGNVLETVTVKEYPVIQKIKDKMLEFGAVGSLMSGSGPTVFGLFTNPKAAQEAYEELRYGESAGLAKQVYLTNFYNQKEEKNHGKQA